MKNRLKELRKALKLTQTEFGRGLNMSFGHISDMEAGRKTITERTISDICARYHVNETWLRTGEGEMFVAQGPDDEERLRAYLAELLMKLPDQARQSTLDFMQRLVDGFRKEK